MDLFFYCKRHYFLKYSTKKIMQNIDKLESLSFFKKEDAGSIPGSGRSPGGRNGQQLQYLCLENPMEEEPSGLQPMGFQRVGHNWSDLAHTHTYV